MPEPGVQRPVFSSSVPMSQCTGRLVAAETLLRAGEPPHWASAARGHGAVGSKANAASRVALALAGGRCGNVPQDSRREISVGLSKYPAHSVCRRQRHTECAGYVLATLIDWPVLTGLDSASLRDSSPSLAEPVPHGRWPVSGKSYGRLVA